MTLALLPKTWSFIGLTRLEQTFHWLISVSRDFRSPKASFPIHLLLIIHLDKGSLVPPPCAHMEGPRSPGLFYYLHKVVGYFIPCSRCSFFAPDLYSLLRILVPRSGSLFLAPDPCSSLRIFIPRSGSSFLAPDPRSSLRIFIPRSGSLFLAPDPCSSLRIFIPRSGSLFLAPDPRSSFRILVPRSGCNL